MSKGKNINSIIGIVLIGIILFGFSFYNSSNEKAKKDKKVTEVTEVVSPIVNNKKTDQKKEVPAIDSTNKSIIDEEVVEDNQLSEKYFIFSNAAAKQEEKEIEVTTEKLKIKLSNKSGRITQVILNEFKTADSNQVILFFKEHSDFNSELTLLTNPNESGTIKTISTKNLYFKPSRQESKIMCKDSTVLSYTLVSNDGLRKLVYSYTIFNNEYEVKFNIKTINLNQVLSPYSDIGIKWGMVTPSQERTISNQNKASTIYYKYENDKSDYISPTSLEKMPLETSTRWVSFKQQYFNSSILAVESAFSSENAEIESYKVKNSQKLSFVKGMRTTLGIPVKEVTSKGFNMKFYFGPNKYKSLEKVGFGLENIIEYGWKIFRVVILYFIDILFEFLYGFGWNIGIVIIILTICVKTILLPLLWKTYVSTAKSKVLKPEIEEINKKYKSDKVKKQQATMALYRETGVNPIAGCIPSIIQIPLLFSLFRFFPNKFEFRQKSFLWAEDLSTFDAVIELPFSIPIYGSHVSLFALLMAISLIFYTRVSQQLTGGGSAPGMDPSMAKNMKMMTYLMPVFSLFFFNSVAAGLSFYYLIANCITILQQFMIKKWFIDEEKIRAKIQENKLKPKKKSKFSQRLNDRLKEAQKLQSQRRK